MTKRNFTREHQRQHLTRFGSESVRGDYTPSAPPRTRQSKAALREEATLAVASLPSVTVLVICACGHKGKVRVPLKEPRPKFRCIKCNQTK